MALPPNLLWHTPHTRSSVIMTLRLRPLRPFRRPSPSRRFASSVKSSDFRKPATIRPSLTIELAARIRPVKYNSNFRTVRTSGINSRVEDAGSRDPCFARSSIAGSHCGSYGFGGDRYSESKSLYMDGCVSSAEVDAWKPSDLTGLVVFMYT